MCPIISIDSSKQIIPTPNRLFGFGREYAFSEFEQVILASDDDTGLRNFLETYKRPVYVKGPTIFFDGYIGLEDIFIIMFNGMHWIMTPFEKVLTYITSTIIS